MSFLALDGRRSLRTRILLANQLASIALKSESRWENLRHSEAVY